jgi:hypothetical protein
MASKQSFEFVHVLALLQFVDPVHVSALTQFSELVHVTAFGQFPQPVHPAVQLVQSAPPVHWQLYSVHKHITITTIINQFVVKPHVLNAIVSCIIVIYLASSLFVQNKTKKSLNANSNKNNLQTTTSTRNCFTPEGN